MSRCTIYKTDEEYIIVTESRTEDWIWIADNPIYRVNLATNNYKLAETILNALKSSRFDIPNILREDFSIREKEILNKMGQSSYKSLYKKSTSCSVKRDENNIVKISPYKPNSPKDFSNLVVVKEKIVLIDMNVNSIPEFESKIIEVLSQDYKSEKKQ
jgi:hypothetical protein